MNLIQMTAYAKESFTEMIKNFLELDFMTCCGRLISINCLRLKKLRSHIKNRYGLCGVVIYDNDSYKNDKNMGGTLSQNLTSKYLGLNLKKRHRDNNWAKNTLPSLL